jgi:hypothetical protein
LYEGLVAIANFLFICHNRRNNRKTLTRECVAMSQKPQQTRLLNSSPSEPMPDRDSTPTAGQLPAQCRLTLQFENGKRTTITLNLDERFVVGRADEGEVSTIGLDLSPFGAAQMGVSRSHAAFLYKEGLVYIEDAKSTNGTRINGFQLTADRLYRLRDGDELEFGRARLVVRFVRSIR